MEDAVPGLKSAMSVPWGGGAFGEILDRWRDLRSADSIELDLDLAHHG